MGLLQAIGNALAAVIKSQPEENQLAIAITLILWVSAISSAFLDNIPYTATMIPVITILADELPETLDIKTLAWALSFGACRKLSERFFSARTLYACHSLSEHLFKPFKVGGNGTLLGASSNIVTAGISTSKGFGVTFLNFLYPGMVVMIATVAISNLYMLAVYVWI